MTDIDPLFVLLRRYQAERKAFDDAPGTDGMTDGDWDRIARATWSRTQDEIIQSEPSTTTAAGALLALDHVLQSDDLFFDRSESTDMQMLWLLVKTARDYIASLDMPRLGQFIEGGISSNEGGLTGGSVPNDFSSAIS